MGLIADEEIELRRHWSFWANYVIIVFCFIMNGLFFFGYLLSVIVTWNMHAHEIIEGFILLIMFLIMCYTFREIKSKTPYHAYDSIIFTANRIEFYNAQSHHTQKTINFTEFKRFKITAVNGDEYAHFYLDLIKPDESKERINLSFYMRPKEYQFNEIRIQELLTYVFASDRYARLLF